MYCVDKRFDRAMLAIVTLGIAATAANAEPVGLEWRPMTQTVSVSDVVGLGLYAVSLSGNDEPFNSAQVVIAWDPAYLQLLGVDQTGAALQPPADSSSFPAGDSWNINEATPPADGDGIWQGLVELGNVRTATTAGTLLTTLEFTALAETPCTEVTMLPSLQKPGYVRGWSKVVQETFNVLDYGNLPSAACVEIVPEPTTLVGLTMLTAIARRRRR